MLDDEARVFLKEIPARIGNLAKVIEYCKEKRGVKSTLTNVLSAALLEIFLEIKDYLDDFETEIAAKYGFSLASEEEKVQQKVIEPFVSFVGLNDPNSVEAALLAGEKLILGWQTFPRESVLESET